MWTRDKEPGIKDIRNKKKGGMGREKNIWGELKSIKEKW